MKRFVILSAILTVVLTAKANDGQSLVFEKADGTQQALLAVGTTITFNGTTLTATNGNSTLTLPLSDLNRMFFSTEGGTTGISKTETVTEQDWEGAEIYDLRGHRLPQGIKLQPGLYIFKKGTTTKKLLVK